MELLTDEPQFMKYMRSIRDLALDLQDIMNRIQADPSLTFEEKHLLILDLRQAVSKLSLLLYFGF